MSSKLSSIDSVHPHAHYAIPESSPNPQETHISTVFQTAHNSAPSSVSAKVTLSSHTASSINKEVNQSAPELFEKIELSNPQEVKTWQNKASTRLDKIQNEIEVEREDLKKEASREKTKRIIILVAACVGLAISLALLGTGIGAAAGAIGVAGSISALMLAVQGIALGSILTGGSIGGVIGAERWLAYNSFGNKEESIKRRDEINTAMQEAIKNDPEYTKFVESIAIEEFSLVEKEKLATTPQFYEAYKKIEKDTSQQEKDKLTIELRDMYILSSLKDKKILFLEKQSEIQKLEKNRGQIEGFDQKYGELIKERDSYTAELQKVLDKINEIDQRENSLKNKLEADGKYGESIDHKFYLEKIQNQVTHLNTLNLETLRESRLYTINDHLNKSWLLRDFLNQFWW